MAKTAAALHILVKEEKLALDLLEQIKNGADFGKLAKKHSICPSGKRGGDLGEWICPYISRHLLSLNPLLACCRRYSRGER